MPSIDIINREIRRQVPSAFITGYFDYATDTSAIHGSPYISEIFASPDFIEAFHERYGVAPQSKGPNAYDILKLLVSAYESSPDHLLSASEVKLFLISSGGHHGAVGDFQINSDGNSVYAPRVRSVP